MMTEHSVHPEWWSGQTEASFLRPPAWLSAVQGTSTLIYISCNSATQARDLALMDKTYRVTHIQPLDMFPQTHHVENIVVLEKKILNLKT